MGTDAPTAINPDDPVIQAIVHERVSRETASLRERAEAAERARDEAQRSVDVLTAERDTAHGERDQARDELAAVQDNLTAERAMSANRDNRRKELREVAAHLTDAFFDEEVSFGDRKLPRIDRIALMPDAEFAGYKQEIASATGGGGGGGGGGSAAGGGGTTGTAPSETAMAGSSAGRQQVGKDNEPSASSRLISRVSPLGYRPPARRA